MSAGNKISQTLSAESEVNNYSFPQTRLKESKAALDSQACSYCSMLVEDEISQQSADQLPRFHINPVEFDGFRIKEDLWNPESEKEEQP
jgi:hypothetical protein